MESKIKEVSMFISGACIPNPGFGGWSVILLYRSNTKEYRKEFSGGYLKTSNNRMQLLSAINGLSLLKEPCKVTIHSSSQYLTDAFNRGWLVKWQRNHFQGIKNLDLWQQLLSLCQQHQVSFSWIKSKSGHPEQERADLLAIEATTSKDLLVDLGYEQLLSKEILKTF